MEKCQECCGWIGSSCICLLAEKISDAFDSLGIREYWISDIKYDYNAPHIVVENILVTEDIQFKE